MNCRVRHPLRGFVGANALEIACCVVRITVVWRSRPNLARPFSETDVTGRARKGLAQSMPRKDACLTMTLTLVIDQLMTQPITLFHLKLIILPNKAVILCKSQSLWLNMWPVQEFNVDGKESTTSTCVISSTYFTKVL